MIIETHCESGLLVLLIHQFEVTFEFEKTLIINPETTKICLFGYNGGVEILMQQHMSVLSSYSLSNHQKFVFGLSLKLEYPSLFLLFFSFVHSLDSLNFLLLIFVTFFCFDFFLFKLIGRRLMNKLISSKGSYFPDDYFQ